MRVLVTGATGFVGRHLVRALKRDNPSTSISCLVKTPLTSTEEGLARLWRSDGIGVIEGDLCDSNVSQVPAPEVDLVFHLAANTATDATEEDCAVNDVGCRNLLKWLSASNTQYRLVFASSIAVLDRAAPADGPLDEASPCVPRTAYGLTKLRGERILQAEAHPLGVDYVILRLATIYGPGAKAGGLFDQLIRLNSKGELLGRINWPGRTSIIHVEDVARIMIFLGRHPKAARQIFCIANPEAPTVGAIAARIRELKPSGRKGVALPHWLWDLSRKAVWSRPVRYLGLSTAQLTFWRFTLVVDDGFWFNTRKLQTLWTQPPVELMEGIADMLRNLPL